MEPRVPEGNQPRLFTRNNRATLPNHPACFSFGMKSATGCDLDHNLEPAIDGRLELMVQIDSNNEIRSCPLYSTSSIANTAVPASQKCEGNF